MLLRVFGPSALVTLAALVAGFAYGGWSGAAMVAILGVLEVSLSFDNAVVNATVLERMNPFWQRMFLTVGILVAVFGMRVLFPLLVVWASSGMAPAEAFDRALNPPADGASHFPDGTPSYETAITDAHPQIAAFGGMFLLLLFLDFLFEDKELTWLGWLERPLERAGNLDRVAVVVGGAALLAAGALLADEGDAVSVLASGLLGMVVYLLVNGLGDLFSSEVEDDTGSDDGQRGPSQVAKAAGKAGFFLFLYLEVLDASFSFDGVVGAFAITADPIVIALGLGFIGAMFVRSITVYLVRTGTLAEYEYLEHGVHWAIGALAVILLVSVDEHLQLPEVVTGLVGVVFIAAALVSSIVRNRRQAA